MYSVAEYVLQYNGVYNSTRRIEFPPLTQCVIYRFKDGNKLFIIDILHIFICLSLFSISLKLVRHLLLEFIDHDQTKRLWSITIEYVTIN